MATSVTQGLSDDQTGGASYRIARRVTLADSMVVRARLGPAGEGRILDISETGMASQSQIPIQPGGKIPSTSIFLTAGTSAPKHKWCGEQSTSVWACASYVCRTPRAFV